MEFNNIQDFKSNFAKIYHSKVVPSLQTLETDRTKTLKSAIIYTIIGLTICIPTLIYCININQGFIGSLAFIGIFISCIIYVCMQKNFETRFKTRIMPIIMQAFGNFSWTNLTVIDTEFIRTSEVFGYFENRSVDDNFTGIYNNMPIDISETELTYTTRDSKGRRHTHTTFKGVIILIGTGKKFTGHTIVRCRGLIGNKKVYDEVKLEDPEFTKQFFVDANDQVEARYILTTAFMERFKKISNTFGTKHAECSFKDGKLLIALATSKDLFKLGSLHRPVTDTEPFMNFLKEIISIFEMIDYLKVTQKTGL